MSVRLVQRSLLMSFLLNYLDGALDTVTGRYDGQEGEESPSEEGSLAAEDADDAGGDTGVLCVHVD